MRDSSDVEYNKKMRSTGWKSYVYHVAAAEISRLTRYGDELIQFRPLEHDNGSLLECIDSPKKGVEKSEVLKQEQAESGDLVRNYLLNGNLNYSSDIQALLNELYAKSNRRTRIVLLLYNPYLRWLYQMATYLGLRNAPMPPTFLTTTSLENMACLSGFEVVSLRHSVYFPFRLFGLGGLINRLMPVIPLVRWLSLTTIAVLRPVIPEGRKPSLSIIVPARNEAGNIQNCIDRLPEFNGAKIEVIFVEGHSGDNTWDEIQRVCDYAKSRGIAVQSCQQKGKGKLDAVRVGFERARNDLLVVLDADLTMPPELLTRYYDAYCMGRADFVNGNRLVYPMEQDAMRFLNHLGNIFFAKALSAILSIRIGDTLCGTKLLSRRDYDRAQRWLQDFGDFDPFGDFQLLFAASVLSMGVIDIPIQYRARTYGATNIDRFRHGFMLLKMMLIGFSKIRLGAA